MSALANLYRWLDGADVLIVRSEWHEPLVVLPIKLAAEMAAVAEGHKAAPFGVRFAVSR
jgi:hypothetical protein